VASVLELLSQNIGLTMLDVSMNHMDYRAALVVEDALMSHTRLTRLNVSSNHLGVLGMRSMLRLLAHDGAGLTSFDAENTATTSEVQSIHQGLVATNCCLLVVLVVSMEFFLAVDPPRAGLRQHQPWWLVCARLVKALSPLHLADDAWLSLRLFKYS
jgi:hypothetical protein